MVLSAVSVLVVAQSSSEIPEGLMNNPVYQYRKTTNKYFLNQQLTLNIYRPNTEQDRQKGANTTYLCDVELNYLWKM